ncbi:uncharacterized protein [Watersipora subatra]|uniref:uncharacterized protein n=1 Tax=Watersipora subatra TaxID=2589382 RepID=UPI00355C32BB
MIKIVKRMLRRCEDPFLALLEYRNTVTEGLSTSPAQRIIGKATRSALPEKAPVPTELERLSSAQKDEKRMQQQSKYNKGARELRPLRVGEPVFLRDYRKHRSEWKEARVVQQLTGRSYSVQVEDDLLRRNRRELRPASVEQCEELPVAVTDNTETTASTPSTAEPPENPVPVRRSGRQRQKPQ